MHHIVITHAGAFDAIIQAFIELYQYRASYINRLIKLDINEFHADVFVIVKCLTVF